MKKLLAIALLLLLPSCAGFLPRDPGVYEFDNSRTYDMPQSEVWLAAQRWAALTQLDIDYADRESGMIRLKGEMTMDEDNEWMDCGSSGAIYKKRNIVVVIMVIGNDSTTTVTVTTRYRINVHSAYVDDYTSECSSRGALELDLLNSIKK